MNGLAPPLRIAYIVGAFPSLSETFVVNQIAGMAERGHQIDIYTTDVDPSCRVAPELDRLGLMRHVYGISVAADRSSGALAKIATMLSAAHRAPGIVWRAGGEVCRSGPRGSIRLLYATAALVRRGTPRYDVIHAQFGQYGLLALQLERIGVLAGAVVTSFRGYDVEKHLRAAPHMYDDLFERGALFLPVSQVLAERLRAAGCDFARTAVLHSGIACRRLKYRETAPTLGPVRLITVARLVEKKGLRFALEAVARARAAGIDVSYTIVGDGPLRRELEALAGKLGVDRNVHWAGSKPHDTALEMIRSAHIMLAPSITAADGDAEGIPNVLKEAMAFGLPVLATRHSGIAELVDDGLSGLLVPERDSEALADRLAYLATHPGLWGAMGRAGRVKVEAEFDIERLSAELEFLYRRAIETHAARSDAGRNHVTAARLDESSPAAQVRAQ